MDPEPSPAALWVGLLGAVELRVDGEEVRVAGTRRRALLATLALARGRAVSVERLVDTLWPDGPPRDAAQALYNHVSRLRGDLGAAQQRLTRQGPGYALRLGVDELDVSVVRGVAEALPGLSPTEVLGRAADALALWRGPALDELRDRAPLDVEAVALDEVRLRLQETLLLARIESGDPAAVSEASAAVAADPWRERGVLLLMQALARDGRTAEAMEAAAAYRRRLADDTGLDPSPAVGRLAQEIAAGSHTPSDGLPTPPGRRTLTRPSGPLVAREREHDEVVRLLTGQRAVTLTGPGGVGKTRLALEAVATLADNAGLRAALVDLTAVEDADRVAQAVSSSIGLRLVRAAPSASDVASALSQTALVLLLDNAEHVVGACRDLVDHLDRLAPGVRVLVTSRVTLHASSEYVVRLNPLPIPSDTPDLTALRRQPSVRAFVEHARRRTGDYELSASDAAPLVEVLRHLDGLPLAIELVAGQVDVLPMTAIRERLGRALDLAPAARGAEDDRQRTLRRTIEWSYDLLPGAEQALLRAIAAFPGGVDLPAVETLAAAVAPEHDPVRLLHGLVDASLLDVAADRTRYRLLFTVRAFLLEAVAALGEQPAADERFVRWAVGAAEEMGAALVGPAEAEADRRLRAELDNLRAARDVARAEGLLDAQVRITLALDRPVIWRDSREVWSWCLELADAWPGGHPREVEILGAAAEAARQSGDYERAVELATRGLDVARVGAGEVAPEASRCWSALAGVAHYRGDFAAAAHHWALAARTPGPTVSALLGSAALAAGYGGDVDLARWLLQEARARDRETPSGSNQAFLTYVEGEQRAVDDPAGAIGLYAAAVEQARAVGATFVAGVAEVALASAQARTGDTTAAAAAYARLLEHWRSTGHGPQLWTTARNAADLLLSAGRRREAALLLIHADAAAEAAAVDPGIARTSGRRFVALDERLDPGELETLRAAADGLTSAEVVDAAVRVLRSVASSAGVSRSG